MSLKPKKENSLFNNNDSFDLSKIGNSASPLDNSNIYNDFDSLINDDIFNIKNIHKYNNCESISNSNNNSYFIKKKKKEII